MAKPQKTVTAVPDDKMNDLTVNFSIDGKPVSWRFLTNIKEDEMYPVLENWAARTEDYTMESLIAYINSKVSYGFKAQKL